MRTPERAAQVWAVLALAARNRQILTYGLLGKLIGVPPVGLGQLLEPIRSFCLLHDLPPLTILVVQEETGLPGSGFTAASAALFARSQLQVFEFDWLEHGAPAPGELESAVSVRSSPHVRASAKRRKQGVKGPAAAAMSPQTLKKIRDTLGLTQEQLAEQLGLQPLTVLRWENGQTPISKGRALSIQGLQARRVLS